MKLSNVMSGKKVTAASIGFFALKVLEPKNYYRNLLLLQATGWTFYQYYQLKDTSESFYIQFVVIQMNFSKPKLFLALGEIFVFNISQFNIYALDHIYHKKEKP